MFYYLYKLTDRKNHKFYYGVHKTENLDDGYMGSGVRLNDKIRRRCDKEILKWFDSEKDMFLCEKETVTESLVQDPNCYNMCVGGNGGDTISLHPRKFDIISRTQSTMQQKSPEERAHINQKKAHPGQLNGMYGSSRTGEHNPMFGKRHGDSTKQKIRVAAIARAKRSDYVNPNKGKHLSVEQKEAIRKHNSRTYRFVKDEQLIIITNLAHYCREHELNEGSMRHVAKGRHNQHRGYFRG